MKTQDEIMLEDIFLHAVKEPAYRPIFLDKLLKSNIYCICCHSDDGSYTSLKTWEDPEYGHIIPFFTSLEKLKKIASKDKFICLSCRALFEMTLGHYLILNPASEAIKEFFPNEIYGLLIGDFGQILESYELDHETQLVMNQPDVYPQFMVDQLKQFFLTELHVIAAYLAQIYDPEVDSEPALIIGLQLDKYLSVYEVDQLHRKIGQVAHACFLHQKTINLVHIDMHKDGINQYFLQEVKPFYIRPEEKKRNFFAKLFS